MNLISINNIIIRESFLKNATNLGLQFAEDDNSSICSGLKTGSGYYSYKLKPIINARYNSCPITAYSNGRKVLRIK